MHGTAQEQGAQLRAVLVEILAEGRPWRTRDLRRAFAPSEQTRIYNQLRKLERDGAVQSFGELDHTWWTAAGATCRVCDRPAHRIIRGLTRISQLPAHERERLRQADDDGDLGDYAVTGGITCDSAECIGWVHATVWPWPEPAAEGLVY